MKQVTFYLALILLLGALNACENQSTEQQSVLKAVPPNAILLAEINDFTASQAIFQRNQAARALTQLPYLKDATVLFQHYSAPLEPKVWQNHLKSSASFASLHLSGAGKYNWLWLSEGGPALEQAISEKYPQAFSYQEMAYAQETIYAFGKGDSLLYLASFKGLLAFSTSKTLVEMAIRQEQASFGLLEDSSFTKVRKLAGAQAPLNLYLQMDPLSEANTQWWGDKSWDFPKELGSWTELDLESEEDRLFFTGVMDYHSSHFSQVFQSVRPQESQGQKVVPQNVALWVRYNFHNSAQWLRNYQDYLDKKGRLSDYRQRLDQIADQPAPTLTGLVDTEMGYFRAGKGANGSQPFAYFKLRPGAEQPYQALAPLIDSNQISGYRGHIIHRLKAQNLLPRVFGSLFVDFHYPFFTLHQGYLLFSNDLVGLQSLINDLQADKNLASSSSYQSLQDELPKRSHLGVLLSNPGAVEWLKEKLPRYAANLSLAQDSLNNLRWSLWQLKVAEEGVLSNGVLWHEKPLKEKVVRAWSISIGAEPIGSPQILYNHRSKKMDVAIQDKEHRLHLIDRSGRESWTYQLDGPILGDIQQIDIYKNNKYQMVFNTAQKLYVVDLLGRDVEGFPYALPQPATAPVGVFNYDQARNYRLVVPCGPDLLNIDVEGKLVDGWQFETANADIISQPQHFSVAGKDIIVCLNAEGKLYQLNRRGEERFITEEKVEELKTSFYLKEGDDLKSSELIAGSNSGKMYVIRPQGKVEALYLEPNKPADHLIYFADRYIMSYEDELIVKHPEHPFSADFESSISAKPKAMIMNNTFYAGAFAAAAEEIRLFNESGDLLAGFPIFAQGPFDMASLNRDGKINIVTYTKDGTLMNYRVD